MPARHVEREVLLDQILGGFHGRLTALVAGAGYGKSTMLAMAAEQAGCPWVWCSCDPRMATSGVVVGHLATALAERFPGFGAAMSLSGDPETQVEALSNEIAETIPDELVIVLDDVYALPSGTAARVPELLVRDLPPSVHLAMASRAELPFPVGRLGAAGEFLELGEDALALSPEEGERLLRCAGIELPSEEARDLHRRTEGWAAGLLLAGRAGSALPRSGGARGGAELFDYLAEEAYDRQPATVRRFLLATSVLDRFSPELAAAVGGEDAHDTLALLLAQHLFVVRLEVDGEWYRYHQLFQSFLLRRLDEEGPGRTRRQHELAGRAWLAAGEPVEGVRHLIEAQEYEAALDALEPVAERMTAGVEAVALAGWLDDIPKELWADRPELAAAAALLDIRAGLGAEGFEALDRAIGGLIDAGRHDHAASACYALLQSHDAQGARHDWLVSVVHAHLDRIDPASPSLPAARILLGVVHGRAGRYREAERELRTAEALPGGDAPGVAEYIWISRSCWIDHRQARTTSALAATARALAALEADESRDPMAHLPFAHIFRAAMLNDLGRYDEALAALERADETAARRGLGAQLPTLASLWRGRSLAGLARWDELELELERVDPDVLRGIGRRRRHLAHASRVALAAHRGGHGRCIAELELTRAALADDQDGYTTALVRCDLVAPLTRVGLHDEAGREVDAARVEAVAARAPLAVARSELLAAALAPDDEAGRGSLILALALTRRYELQDLWARVERRRAAPLLARALSYGGGSAAVAERLLAACGGDVLAEAVDGLDGVAADSRRRLAELAAGAEAVDAAALDPLAQDPDPAVRDAALSAQARIRSRPRAPLRLVTLGAFSVLRGGTELSATALGRPRVRSLMAVLMAADGPLHRELLLEWLWPSLPPQRGLRSLHTTVFELRRALEPDAARLNGGSVVRTEGESYRLALSERDDWDVETFLALTGHGHGNGNGNGAGLERLLAAEAAYTGEFLPEWRYAPWATARRAEIEEAYDGALERLAEALLADGQPGAAISRYRRLLSRDPGCERHHRGMMRAYAAAGDRGLALNQYHRCRALLLHRLGTEPSPETRALFASLL